jgi:geranylgeranyl diphosphate synthase type II
MSGGGAHHSGTVDAPGGLFFLCHDDEMTSGARAEAAFSAYLEARRTEIENAIAEALPRPPACPPLVAEAIRYSLEAGGKRLRPVLTLAAAEAIASAQALELSPAESLAEARRMALPAACALEFIHTYSLIHDDLPAMDDDTLRRGRPTLHVVYGEGIAILAGDGLLTEAFALLARQRVDDAGAGRRLRVLARIAEAAGVAGMVGGQAIDLESEGTARIPGRTPPALDGQALQDMHARKTGALIRAAAVSGAIMAGGDSHQVEAIDRYATDLGLVFQIVDDILDVEGASHELGKTAGKDAAANKPTYPSLFGIERSRALAADGIARAARSLTDAGLAYAPLLQIAQWVVGRSH